MQVDLEQLTANDRFELLTGTVVPRPIAVVTTLTTAGTVNAAPYSFFNIMGHDPAVVALGVLPHPEGRFKDTGRNILATDEFVVNLVSEDLAEAMNVTCIDAPPDVDELQLAKLAAAPSVTVKPPRIATSPVAFECRVHASVSLGRNQAIIIGRVLWAHIADQFVRDPARRVIDTAAMKLIGGMHGARWYTRSSDLFEMERPTWAGWQREGRV